MLPFRLIYSDDYYLPIGSHVFPAQKYRLVRDALLASGMAAPGDFVTPQPARDDDILLVHTPEYVRKLKTAMPALAAHLKDNLKLDLPDFGYFPPEGTAAWKT